VQEGRRQGAEGRRKESLYSQLYKLFQLDSYFRHAALATVHWSLNTVEGTSAEYPPPCNGHPPTCAEGAIGYL
jgi:hypothetical protein